MLAILLMENTIDQIHAEGFGAGTSFGYEGRGLDLAGSIEGWLIQASRWNQFSLRVPLADGTAMIGASSISASPEAAALQGNLNALRQGLGTAAVSVPGRMSILDFPRLNLGTVLRPLGPDDDLLGEMLDEAWS
jgi:hypothetical protein